MIETPQKPEMVGKFELSSLVSQFYWKKLSGALIFEGVAPVRWP